MNANQRRKQRRMLERMREIERNKILAELGMSASQKAAVTALAKKVEKEDAFREIQVEEEAAQETVDQIQKATDQMQSTPLLSPAPEPMAVPEPIKQAIGAIVEEKVQQAEQRQTRSSFAFATRLASKIKSVPQTVQNASIGFADSLRIGKPTEEQRRARQDILKINNQLILTTKIIEANKDELEKLATSDESVKKLLETLKSDELKTIKSIQERILRGEEISSQETQTLIQSLEGITEETSKTKVSLDANLGLITNSFSSLILNDELERDDRRAMLKELAKIYDSNEIQEKLSAEQKAEIEKLKMLATSDINFSKDQTDSLNGIFTNLKNSDLNQVKLRGTLNDLNESIESAILTQESLKEKLDSQNETGNTLRAQLQEGIKGVGKTFKAAAIDALLGQFGLGGLGIGDALSDFGIKDLFSLGKNLPGKLGGLLGKFPGANKLGAGLGGLLGKLPGGLGKFGGMAGGVIGKLALPLLAAKGIFDFGSGFVNPNEIAGLKEGEQAGFGTKIQAGTASLLSGLSFGLVDPSTIFQGISTGLDFLFGDEGILTLAYTFFKEKIGSIASFAKQQFTEMGSIFGEIFSGDGFFSGMWKLAKKIMQLSPIGLMFTAAQNLLPSIFGEGGFFAKIFDFLTNIPKSIMGVVEEIFGAPDSFVQKIKEALSEVGDFFFGEEGLFTAAFIKNVLKDTVGGFLPDSVSNRLFGSSADAQIPEVSDTQATVEPVAPQMARDPLSSFREDQTAKERQRQEMLNAAKSQKVAVVQSSQGPQEKPMDRSAKVDDLSLAVMQTQLAGI